MEIGLPLKGGMLQRVPPTASKEEQAAALNDVIDRLNGLLKTQIFSDGVSKRMLIGYQKAGFEGGSADFGIKMSIAGVDVTVATDAQLLFSMSLQNWTWRNSDGQVLKQFRNETGTDTYFDTGGRNYVNIGKRPDTTVGLEMAKPTVDLGYDPL